MTNHEYHESSELTERQRAALVQANDRIASVYRFLRNSGFDNDSAAEYFQARVNAMRNGTLPPDWIVADT